MELAERGEDFRPQKTVELLEQLDALIDWRSLRGSLSDVYKEASRPALDPVLLVKLILLGHLYRCTCWPGSDWFTNRRCLAMQLSSESGSSVVDLALACGLPVTSA